MSACVRTADKIGATFYPLQTLKCVGQPVFRSQAARDYACLLDVDDTVTSWRCCAGVDASSPSTVADLVVQRQHHRATVIVVDGKGETGVPYGSHQVEIIYRAELPQTRLQNARELLRYVNYRVGLSDRIRLLACLDEHGSLSVAECLHLFQDVRPIAGIARLFLQRFIDIDIDEALIGPESQVRRKRD